VSVPAELLTAMGGAGFAGPEKEIDDDLLDLVVGGHARAVTRSFLTTHGDQVGRSPGLSEVLESFACARPSFDLAWDVSAGALSTTFRRPWGPAAQVAAVEFALHLHERGAAGSWECRFPEPVRVRAGRSLLPPADRLRVTASGGRLAVDAWLGGRREPGTEPLVQEQGITFLPRAATRGPAFTGTFADRRRTDGSWNGLPPPLDAIPETVVAALHSALGMLDRHAPQYHRWVTRAVRYVVPLTPVPGVQISSSTEETPATVSLTARPHAAELAETLVHESAHQYLHMLARLGPLDDGSDPTLYYSPLKGTGRPVRGILVAYHAVGNILLWTRAALANGTEDPAYVERNAAELPGKLQLLDEALATTDSLTPLGLLLWRPLRTSLGDLALT
jgi:HEXXH motif-containing protein